MKFFYLIIAVLFILSSTHGQNIADSARFNRYGKIVSRLPVSAEARVGILVFESANQEYRLWFDISVQLDGQIFSGHPLNPIENGTTVRRARFATRANLGRDWYAELDLNFANGQLELEDAYMRYEFLKGFKTRVGNYKEKFSMSETGSSRYLNFMERSMVVTAFAPSRHFGWEISANKKWWIATGGIFTQAIEDAETSTDVEDNNKDFGKDQGISLTGKLVLLPVGIHKNYGVHLAYAWSTRQAKTDVDPAEHGGIRYSTRSLSNINRKKYLDTDVISDYDHQEISNIEAAAYYNGMAVQSEIIRNKTVRSNDKDNLYFGGFYVQAVGLLFGGRQVYNKMEGEFTEPEPGKKWGDIELALRYDYIDLNNKSIHGGSAEGLTAGVNFYAARNVKFQVNFSHLNHDRYANGNGELFIGRDATGALTKDYRKAVKGNAAGDDFNQLGLRCQINF